MSLLKKQWTIKINSHQNIKSNYLIQILDRLSYKLKHIDFQQVENHPDIIFQLNTQKNQCLYKIRNLSQKKINLTSQITKQSDILKMIKELKKLGKKQLFDWGELIKISSDKNIIKIELPAQQKYPENTYSQIKMLHLYLYKNTVGQSQPISHIQSNNYIQDSILEFKPGMKVPKQIYRYKFGIQVFSNQVVIAKQGKIIAYGQIKHYNDIQFPDNQTKNNSTVFLKQLKYKVDQLKKLDIQKNILYIGTPCTGKSLYIKYFMRMLSQCCQFSYSKEPNFNQSEKYDTTRFKRYQLHCRRSDFKLALIDSPGIGGKLDKLKTFEYNILYFQALKYLLNGSLNQDQFQIPFKLDIERAKTKQIKQKRIDHCLIFIHPNEPKQISLFIRQITEQLMKNRITYGFVINKTDQIIGNDFPNAQKINAIKRIIKLEGYRMQEDQIFIQSLSKVYFPQNEMFYHEFNRCNYFSLASTMK